MIKQQEVNQQIQVLSSSEEGLDDVPSIAIRDKAPVLPVVHKY
jgi:hypothetical protein